MANVCTFELHLRGCRSNVLALVGELNGIYALAVCSACGNESGIPAVKKLRDTRPY